MLATDPMTDRSLTEELAGWLTRWRKTGFPEATLATARDYVLDWLGSALAGGVTNPGVQLLDCAEAQPEGPCSIAGAALTRSAEVAALVNGLEYNLIRDSGKRRRTPGLLRLKTIAFEQVTGDNQALDFVGAFTDDEERCVAVVAFDW